jgi:hypothetical protein
MEDRARTLFERLGPFDLLDSEEDLDSHAAIVQQSRDRISA